MLLVVPMLKPRSLRRRMALEQTNMNSPIEFLEEAYESALASPDSKNIDITLDRAANGLSAFVDIFGFTASARITVYQDGKGDFEIISSKQEYNYVHHAELTSRESIQDYVFEFIRLVKQYDI
ncbi:hypothetical protein IFT66_00130 [Rhizobium sp. CFBP 13726]|uniref:hypothetical protein n=1 Tax=Rhizobium sp. CFBP 13726 TaxID=2775296 RepID=UPI00177ABD10|nr:hypothetical protein [Rhizobium sp. CFBP 13726]MBD8649479.1 hypothetical protein [Rhizobium sp. CFBP 13726]